ncbi:exosporium leader peptide-containing protein [Bacillus thuringiensis]|uniref:exosporium leader peptide-containing protein n=1 Tax=Bacillus thuringiensis TaxID=1428 RepID=UPI00235516F2|nr:exosporium leader peptide-containing protein [Bacillus thuringiensis]
MSATVLDANLIGPTLPPIPPFTFPTGPTGITVTANNASIISTSGATVAVNSTIPLTAVSQNNGIGICLAGNSINLAPSAIYHVEFYVLANGTNGTDVSIMLDGIPLIDTHTSNINGTGTAPTSDGAIINTAAGGSSIQLINSTIAPFTLINNIGRRSVVIRIIQIG